MGRQSAKAWNQAPHQQSQAGNSTQDRRKDDTSANSQAHSTTGTQTGHQAETDSETKAQAKNRQGKAKDNSSHCEKRRHPLRARPQVWLLGLQDSKGQRNQRYYHS
jgi:hypothetical protein